MLSETTFDKRTARRHLWQTVGLLCVLMSLVCRVSAADIHQPEPHSPFPDLREVQIVHSPNDNTRLTKQEAIQLLDSCKVGDHDSLGFTRIDFRVNKTYLEPKYMDNAEALRTIHKALASKEVVLNMGYIVVSAAASPEGYLDANKKLAAGRALAIKEYLLDKYPFIDPSTILTFSMGENWSGLRQMVATDPNVPYKQQVLNLIDDQTCHNKRWQLRTIGNGAAFEYISANMLPYLRGAATCMIYYKNDPAPVVIREHTHDTDTVYIETVVERVIEVPVEAPGELYPRSPKPYYWALKTNLIYDAALLPNLAVEFSMGKSWSIEAQGQWSWWNTDNSKHYFHRIQMGGVEVRKWFGKANHTPLRGHFIGLYGMGGTYDLKFGTTGYLSNNSYSAGISYGYSTPIGRRLNLEFGLGIGYFGGTYHKYKYLEEFDCYHWFETKELNYLGLTKASISLVWLVGSGWNFDKIKQRK